MLVAPEVLPGGVRCNVTNPGNICQETIVYCEFPIFVTFE